MMEKRFAAVALATILCCSFVRIPAPSVAQTARAVQIQRAGRAARRTTRENPPVLPAQAPTLPKAVSPDIVWVQCPAAATALYPTVACGYLPVPMHREQPKKTEKMRIHFEVYPHTNAGQAVSAILVNGGGPGFSTTAFRATWVTMFAPNLDAHDLLLQDDRGTGLSGAIDCKLLQFGLGPTLDDEVADCAAQLGDDDSVYGDGDSSQDVEALRSALGYDLVDYYGQSAGESDVVAYGTRFPQHLRSLTLDSPADNNWFSGRRYYARSAPVREIRLDCLRSPTCAADHPNPDDEFAQLVRAVGKRPVRGHAYDASGNVVPVDLDETGLLNLVFNAGQGQILDGGELLAAGDSLRRGDTAPLLRLGAEGISSFVGDNGYPTIFSLGATAAIDCVAIEMPYDWTVPPQQRLQQFADAVADLPPDYFAPFSRTAYTKLESSGVSNSGARVCLSWEFATPPPPVVPPGASYPNVPALVFAGDIEGAVSYKVAALFPDATYLVVPEGLHVPAASNQCATNLITNLIETLQKGDTSCLKTPELIFPAQGRFALVAADARPAQVDPAGNSEIGVQERKVVTVAVATAVDALKRSTLGSGSGVGLRAGTFQSSVDANGNQTTTLTDCMFATDVTINGSLVWGADQSFAADLAVSGSGTAGGNLHVQGTWEAPGPVGNFKVSGVLGGKQVAVLLPEA